MKQSLLKDRSVPNVLISGGSNGSACIRDATSVLDLAHVALAKALGATVQASRFFRTPAFPAGAGPDFANVVFAVQSDVPAADILAICHRIEAEAGRTRATRWGQRSLDLDLLAWGDLVLPDPDVWSHWQQLPLDRQMTEAPDQLILPHPRIADRSFVLVPMADVAPAWVHPVSGRTVDQMLAALTPADRASVVPIDPAGQATA